MQVILGAEWIGPLFGRGLQLGRLKILAAVDRGISPIIFGNMRTTQGGPEYLVENPGVIPLNGRPGVDQKMLLVRSGYQSIKG